MKKRLLIIALAIIVLALIGFLSHFYVAVPKAAPTQQEINIYISAHTTGVISTRSSIRVVFASNMVGPEKVGQEADPKLLRIKPAVSGVATWLNEKTLEFKPNEPLPGDKVFQVNVFLSRLVKDISKQHEKFTFSFQTARQAMEVKISGIEFYDDISIQERRLAGKVITADFADGDKIKKTLKASQNGKKLDVTWEGSYDGLTHFFWVEKVIQTDDTGVVKLTWSGKHIDADYDETINFEVPPKGVFNMESYEVIHSPEQCVEIRFTEPLDPSQSLNGLIWTDNETALNIIVEKNIAKVFPATRLTGEYNLYLSDGIRNINRKKLEASIVLTINFTVQNPEVKLIGQGVIMPTSEGILFPFQSVSLRAVDVTIIRIFEQNIAQFLQMNALDGQHELARVGRQIVKKTILLDQNGRLDYSTWNTHYLDLSELIKAEPGAIYQVIIDFKREYSAYICNGQANNDPINTINETYNPQDDTPRSYYYYDDDYDYDYDYDYGYYDWYERDNPCHNSYYYNRSVRRNVIASDLGIIAKWGTDGSMLVAVTNLSTARPASGVTIDLLNYQQQVIRTLTTDNDGLATTNLSEHEKPFLAIAKSGKQRGYLKLGTGSSLPLSAFDVSGVAVREGLKGFIYGDRGVWRPGDTLFVSFILEDKGKTLPANHPITFELTNPNGQLVYRKVTTNPSGGISAFPIATDSEDITGTYTARVKVGGTTFSKPLRVEAIMPNRLKININFDSQVLRYGKTNRATVTSAWLHGAPARDLRVNMSAILSQSTTAFNNYPGYVFDDPARSFYAEEQEVFDGRLNDKGAVTFNPNISVRTSAPGVLKASFTVRVFEEGGEFSIDRFTLPYHPHQHYVGVRLPESGNRGNVFYTDTTYTVDFVTVTSEGIPVPNKSLEVEVYKIDWRWWWDRSGEDLSNYITSSYHRPIQKAYITTNSKGIGQYSLRINHPEWGRFLIRAVDSNGTHATGTIAYFDWPGWVKRDKSLTPEAESMLVFATDKEKYNVGETANLTIPSPEGGKIFITIENGVKVLQALWVDAKNGETIHKIPITSEMAPNVYINAMLLQPHAQTVNDLPMRLYGIAGITVEDPQTHLTPTISLPNELAPEKTVTITVAEKNGKPMAFTLAVVDEGLLDITRFKTPNPWADFYAREALGVKTWDLYDLVMGAQTGQLQRIISIGGGDENEEEESRTANRFKPVVRYFGPFELGKGKKQKISFQMPNYIGSVRVMAVAAKDGAYGSAEKTVPVRKPLMVLSTLPRVLGPEEEVVLPVTVFAMDKNVKHVKVKVETNDLLTIKGQSTQTIDFKDIGDQVVRFNLRVASRLGVGKVKVIAESGKEKATHEIELNVRNPNPAMTLVQDTILRAESACELSYKAFGISGTNTAVVELSSLPPLNLGSRLKYLLDYPHGCLEQTISKAFPQLFISKLSDFDDETRKISESNVRLALDKIKTFRTTEGGLSLWPGSYYPDEWATTYAGHFMLEAEKLGYSLPIGVMDGWKEAQRKLARSWTSKGPSGYRTNDLMQAYRLYTLALAKSPDMGAMNRLRETSNLSIQAKWRLAAAYALVGNPEVAKDLIRGVPTAIDNYREQGFTYGSDIRDRAMIVETLILLGDFSTAMPLLRELSQRLGSDSWMSTQEISYSLLAFAKYASNNPASEGVDVNIGIHGNPSKRYSTKLSVIQHRFDPVQEGSEKIVVKNNGKGLIYIRLITQGIPSAGQEVEQNNNLNLEVSYFLMDETPILAKSLMQGTDFYANVRVYNPGTRGNLDQLILSFIVPSGWEIRTSRLDEGETPIKSSSYIYQDIRDDRVYTYFSLQTGEVKNFVIRLNAAYEGQFYMPGVSCEAMYDNTISARKQGSFIEVGRD